MLLQNLYKSFWLLPCTVLLFGAFTHAPIKKRYTIEPGSKLYLAGTTNVNQFNCHCEDRFVAAVFEGENNGTHVAYRNTGLSLTTRNFNCHNRKMEEDLQKALRAKEFPYIKLTMLESWQNPKCLQTDCYDWTDISAKVNITITNVTKTHHVQAKVKRLGPNRFQVIGEKALQMTEFGITPPEAMFGLIKVHDLITFKFDMTVKIE